VISKTSIIHDGAIIGENVSIGDFSIIHSNVVIDDNVVVGSHCVLGSYSEEAALKTTHIGRDSVVRSHSVIYEDVEIGESFNTGHHVTIREKSVIGRHVQVGTLSDVQGDCSIGNFTKLHSNVHIGQGSKIHEFVWIFPYVVLTNDPHPPSNIRIGCEVKSFAVIATMSILLPGVKVGVGALVGAHSRIARDVENEELVAGNPAKSLGKVQMILLRDGSSRQAYPWVHHFNRNYPADIASIYFNSVNNKDLD
jgi:acetyltransferase-like isoleucine patch superfamily enzyme